MAGAPLKILLAFDLSVPLKPEAYADYMNTEDWETEANILSTLKKLGHEVKPFGVHNDIHLLIEEVTKNPPDLIFNLTEAYRGDRKHEPHLAGLFELLHIPYTGADPFSLHICKDKALTKKILTYHRLKVPRFLISRKSAPLKAQGDLKYPVFIKPLDLEASEGISQLSFAENRKDAMERVRYLHEKFETDVIIEEYVDGRELYVGVIGNEKLNVFPPRELFFKEVADGEPKFASFRAKWDNNYRKKWGIKTGIAQLTEEQLNAINANCKKIYRALGLRGYGRIDLRLTPAGEIFCIEANPNPSVEKESDFALSAFRAGMSYEELIGKMISLALT